RGSHQGETPGIFIVLSGFATTDLSVRFCDARQGGGAYGKPALPWPYRFPVKFLPGIFQEISAPFVSPHRSPQPNDRAQRVSERGSGIYPVSHILLTRRCRLFSPAT
ncbi:hypothetical protein VC562_28350, partial [Citrobacter freundii]|nr:hypothetical protein [Citrobacter freundii]MEB0410204.1 hypothetical protein [Citrobacter freundii]